MPSDPFHPAVSEWFARTLGDPTDAQVRAWEAIGRGDHTLVAAPTGSGKTLAAFLHAIDRLIRRGLEAPLPDQTHVLYISPLKALSNDIEKNLRVPLEGIDKKLLSRGLICPEVRTAVRTGDTSSGDRQKMVRKPPHILITTPESFYLLLTSKSGRRMLQTVGTVIVDEIHALAPNKRGAHLALSLERLEGLVSRPPQRIGLSATQSPIERIGDFLTGGRGASLIDTGHQRRRDLAIELPAVPLEPIMAGDVWGQIYDQLARQIETHRTTLIFVNTRRMAERVARHLAERVGEEAVTSHHGSLSTEHRLNAETRLKAGTLKALVATASMELGIDIGDVDLVCQLGSPKSINAFLQRVGRSNHGVHQVPKGRLYPLSRDDLVESAALLKAVETGRLDGLCIPDKPLDVLAQQIVAEVAAQPHGLGSLYRMVRGAWPYRRLSRETFDQVVAMLAEGFSTRRGRRAAHLHLDA
ncbi:MAG: DEAD/DEAH box helicase, partial [Phycisphaeraceae bacterium]|nr:DEAD/DEAH box helicase [Phycisphaeraceae bacterium]